MAPRKLTTQKKPKTGLPVWFQMIVILLLLVMGYLGVVKHLEIPNVVKVDFREGAREICVPWWKRSMPHVDSTTTNRSDWKDRGGDGHGGNLVSYDITRPGTITSTGLKSCAGCGGHFWMCPDPRCSGRATFEKVDDHTTRAWAALDDSSNFTVAFDVNYTTSEGLCWGKP